MCRSTCEFLVSAAGSCYTAVQNNDVPMLADCTIYPTDNCFGLGDVPKGAQDAVLIQSETELRTSDSRVFEIPWKHERTFKLALAIFAATLFLVNFCLWIACFGACSCCGKRCMTWTISCCSTCKAPPYESELTLRVEPAGEPFSIASSKVIMGRTPIPSGPHRRYFAAKLAASTPETVNMEELAAATKITSAALSGTNSLIAATSRKQKDSRKSTSLEAGTTFETLRAAGLVLPDGTPNAKALLAALSGDTDDPVLVDPLMQRGYLLARPANRAARVALLIAIFSSLVALLVCAADCYTDKIAIPPGPSRAGFMGVTLAGQPVSMNKEQEASLDANDHEHLPVKIVPWIPSTSADDYGNHLVEFPWELAASTLVAAFIASLTLWALVPMTQLKSYPFWLLKPATLLSTLYAPVLLFATYRDFEASIGVAYSLTRDSFKNVSHIDASEGAIYTWPITFVLMILFPFMAFRAMRVIARAHNDSTLASQPGMPVVFDHNQMNDLLRYLDATKLNLTSTA